MNKTHGASDHLIKNLERISPENSIFDYKSGRKAFLSLGQGNISEWLGTLLPNTRLILEPKIIGSLIGIQYIDGKIKKAINENSGDITRFVMSIRNIPKSLPFKNKIEIRGIVYNGDYKSNKTIDTESIEIHNSKPPLKSLRFCAFQIFHCNINHFQALQELKKLNFEIPQTQFTKFVSDIEIYIQCWREGKLFKCYPSNGIIMKVNSKKLQKYLGENNISIHWAYAIN